MKNILSKKFLLCLTSFFVFLFASFVGVLLPLCNISSFAFTSSNENSAVKLGELWIDEIKDSDGNTKQVNKFNGDNINLLLQLITGDRVSSVFELDEVKKQATNRKKASDIRATEITAEFNGTTIQKTNTQDIIVTLGKLDWTVTYLSLDKDGNPILTLWLANSEQLGGQNYGTQQFSATGSAYWGYVLSQGMFSSSEDYPDNMYGTSYIRSLVLNNGGEYLSVNNRGTRTLTDFEKREDSVFAPFTVPVIAENEDDNFNDITDFIVTPSNVSWQENQSYINYFTEDETSEFTYFNRANDAWSKETTDDGFSTLLTNENYASKTKSDVWKDDYIWLPSITEVGSYNNNTDSIEGMWGSSSAQLTNNTYTWLRSGYVDNASQITTISAGGNVGSHDTYIQYGIRPALHLNLNTVVEHTTTERDISLCEFNNLDSQEWNPIENIIPEITVTDPLFVSQPRKDIDYEIIVPEITGPGIVDIKVIGHDRYKGEKIVKLELTERNLLLALIGNDDEMKINEKDFCNDYIIHVFNFLDYGYLAPNGDEKVNADKSPVPLVEDTDYELSFENNFNVGTATIKIKGINKYNGSTTATFEIVSRSVSEGKLTLNKRLEETSSEECYSVEYYYDEDVLLVYNIFETLVVNGVTLIKDRDYTLSWFNIENEEIELVSITEIGEYIAVVTGFGNYKDDKSIRFEVTQATIKDSFLIIEKDSYTYTGSAIEPIFIKEFTSDSIEPKFTVKFEYIDGKIYTFVEEQDFITTYGDNTVVATGGSITIIAIETGKFKGTVTATFNITPKDIESNDIIDSEIEDQNYYVTALTPDFTLTDITRKLDLEETIEYTIEYSNNINVGTAIITIKGTGNYGGTRIKEFTIIQRDINLAIFKDIENETYTGLALTPTLTITDRENKILILTTEDKAGDYTVVYSNNINVTSEEIKAKVLVTGKGNYTGTKELTFDIDPRSIATGVVTLDELSKIYTGSSFTPIVTLTLDGKIIERYLGEEQTEENVNFIIRYFFNDNDVTESGMINVGTYTIKVIGKHNYSREASTTFKIKPFDIDGTTAYDITGTTVNGYTKTFSYNKLVQNPEITLKYGNLILKVTEDVKDFVITYYKEIGGTGGDGEQPILTEVNDTIDVGIYHIIYEGEGNYTGTKDLTFEITSLSLKGAEVTFVGIDSVKDVDFNNEEQKLLVSSVIINGLEFYDELGTYIVITYTRDSIVTTDFKFVGKIDINIEGKNSNNITDNLLYSYKIKPLSIDDAEIIFVDVNYDNVDVASVSYTFNGEGQKISVKSITINGKNFYDEKGSFFSVTYTRNSTVTTDFTNYGTIEISIVTTTENILGSFEISYTVKQKSLLEAQKNGELKISGLEDRPYNTLQQKPTVNSVIIVDTAASNYVLPKANYSITIEYDCVYAKDNIPVVISIEDNCNYIGSITETFSINKAKLTSFTLKESSGFYDRNTHTIIPVLKADNLELSSEGGDYSYEITKDGKQVYEIDFINAGELTVKIILKNTDNYEIEDGFVDTQTYTIKPAEIEDVKIRIRTGLDIKETNTVQYDTQTHTIELSKVTTKNNIDLLTDEYKVTYEEVIGESFKETEVVSYINVITIRVKVTSDDNNFTGSAFINFVITPRPIVSSEIVYYVANEDGSASETQIALSNKFLGEYVVPDINIAEGNTNLELGKDYTFGVYFASDTSYSNDLYGSDGYLGVGTYNFVVIGIGNFSGTIIQNYVIDVADFNQNTITVRLPAETTYTSNSIIFDFASEDILITYTKQGHLPITLIYDKDFELFTGWVEVTFKAGSLTEIESAVVLTNQTYINNNKNKDNVFEVSDGYINNVNVGLASVILTAKGSNSTYQIGTAVVAQFKINQVVFTESTLEITNLEKSYIYTGYNITPDFYLKSLTTGNTLSETTDYLVEYKYGEIVFDNINVGEVSFTITGQGNYSGSITFENIFKIVPKDVEKDMFQISKDEIYNTYEQKPLIMGVFNSKSLVLDVDYKVTFERDNEETTNFINAGVISITINGKGNFSGEFTHYYTIAKIQISSLQLSNLTATYTGGNLMPTFIVSDSNGNILNNGYKLQCVRNTLENGNLIDVADSNFTDVGEIKIFVKIVDETNYELKDNEELTATFTITKATLSNASISLDNASLVYTGSALVPTITVELNGKKLNQENNYELSFILTTLDGETPVDEMINAGSYKIKLGGTSNFEGSLQTDFTITRYNISNIQGSLPTDYEKEYIYNGRIQRPYITLKYGTQVLEEGNGLAITYRKEHLAGSLVKYPIDAGIYYIILEGDGNYTGIINTLTFKITPLDLKDGTITFKDIEDINNLTYTFNGLNQKVEVESVSIAGIEFISDDINSIAVIYTRGSEKTEDFMSAGIIGIKIEAVNADNISGFCTYSYEIKQKEFSSAFDVSGLGDRVYDRQKQTFDIALTDIQANNYELILDKDYRIDFTSVGNCTLVEKDIIVTFTSLNNNYKSGSFTKTFSINKAIVDEFELTEITNLYTSNPHNITATVFAGNLELFDFEGYNEYQLIFKRNGSAVTNLTSAGEIQVELKLLDTANFEIKQNLVTTLTYTITRVEINEVTLQEVSVEFDNTNHSIIIESVKSENDLNLKTTDYVVIYIVENEETTNQIYKDACTVTVKVTAVKDGNFFGSATTTFTITKREILDNDIVYFVANENGTATEKEFEFTTKYRGERVIPKVVVTFDNENIQESYTLVLNNEEKTGDYTFNIYTLEDYNRNKENNLFGKEDYLLVGSYVFVIMGKNNFSGTIVANYEIIPADFDISTISITIPERVNYTGKEVTVDFESEEVSVTYTKAEGFSPLNLILGTDFKLFTGFIEITFLDDKSTISSYRIISEEDYNILKDSYNESIQVLKIIDGYANNIISGVATLVITGIAPNFERDTIILAQFTINRVTLKATILGIKDTYTYTGYAIVPEIRVLSQDTDLYLEEGIDYEIEYTNNINVGYAGYLLTAKNNYSGVIEVNNAFYIEPKQIDISLFSISKDTTYVPLKVQKPEITAKYNTKVMVEDEDYEVVFKKNGDVTTDFTNAGVITIELKGINNYSGEFTKTYRIEKWIIKEVKLSFTEVTYNAEERRPEIQVLGDQGEEIDSAGYEITFSNEDFINAGTITIFANVKDNVNYALLTPQVSAVFTINKANLSNTTTAIEDQTFTNLEITPTFALMLGEHLVDETEYSITSYVDNVNVGTAKILISSQNINYQGTKEIEFTILPKKLEESMYSIVEEKTFVYDGEPKTLDFELRYTLNDSYSTLLVRGTDYNLEYENNINANLNDSAVLTITGINNYTGSITRKFSIAKANPTVIVDLPNIDLFAGDSLESRNFLILRTGSTLGTLTNSTVETLIVSNPVTWNFVPEDIDNYNTSSGTIYVPAYYETSVEFRNFNNLIEGDTANASIVVTFKTDRNQDDAPPIVLPVNNYDIIITKNGSSALNYEESGMYNIRIVINNTNYKIVGNDSITFQVMATTIYSSNSLFYAICETGFDVNVTLNIQVIDDLERVSDIIGDNFSKVDDIQKLYIASFYNGNSQVEVSNAIIYFNVVGNYNYYLLQDDKLVLQEITNGSIKIGANTYVVEALIPFANFTQYLIMGAIGLGVLVVLILVIIIAVKVKRKRKKEVQQGVGNAGGNVQNANMQNVQFNQNINQQGQTMQGANMQATNQSMNAQTPNNQPIQTQNLNALIGQVNPNVNNQMQSGVKQTAMPYSNNNYPNANYNVNNGVNSNNLNSNPYYNTQNIAAPNNAMQNKNFNATNKSIQPNNAGQNAQNPIYTNRIASNPTSLNPYSYVKSQGNINQTQNIQTNINIPNQNNSGIQPLSPSALRGGMNASMNNTAPLNPKNLTQRVGNVGPSQNTNNFNQNIPNANSFSAQTTFGSDPLNRSLNGAKTNNLTVTQQTNINNTNMKNITGGYQSLTPNKNTPQKPKTSINPNSVLGSLNNQNPPKK